MNVITGERCSGKTYELIKRAAASHGIIAVGNRVQKALFTHLYIPEMVARGVIPEDNLIVVCTLEDLLYTPSLRRRGQEREVFIDDLDLSIGIIFDKLHLNLNTAVISHKEGYANWTECDYKEGD